MLEKTRVNYTPQHTYYNELEPVLFKEYGRTFQQMVRRLPTVPDKDKRLALCKAMIEIVKRLSPQTGHDPAVVEQKIWDHLHLISSFQLDVEGPYPIPAAEKIVTKPETVPYNQVLPRFKTYGINLERMVIRACAMPEGEERSLAAIQIARLMKFFFSTFNRDFQVEDPLILQHLKELSKGQLVLDRDKVVEEGWLDLGKNLRGRSGEPRQETISDLTARYVRNNERAEERRGNRKRNNNHRRRR